ncbi:unnamed protein product [Pleuronectes platessa]|uniref:Uncharacterized protein n=1 Tax=Pleuronectes platessa TaxID=8262 RepID=A0A9N7Z8U2_PLEPL|nr:unnamed protein product [Pleuronectes platessa]
MPSPPGGECRLGQPRPERTREIEKAPLRSTGGGEAEEEETVRKIRASRKALRGSPWSHGEGVPWQRRRSYLSVSVKTEKHKLAFSLSRDYISLVEKGLSMNRIAMRGNLRFSILPKDASEWRMVKTGIEPPTFWLVDD